MLMCEKIRQQRKNMNITQDDLGQKIGVSLKTVQRWENGERTPNSSIIPKLANALNTTVSYLMGVDDISAPQSEPVENLELDNSSSMSYWGGVIDNAREAIGRGDTNEISIITSLVKSAYDMLTNSRRVEHSVPVVAV